MEAICISNDQPKIGNSNNADRGKFISLIIGKNIKLI